MPGRLEGAGIVVTRPDGLRDELARRLAAEGARVFPFRAFHIEPLDAAPPAGPFDAVLFTSPTTVRRGLPRLAKPLPELRLAPGRGTRAALIESGIGQVFAPRGGAGLAPLLDELPSNRLAGLRLLVVCGRPLNEANLATLTEHGARVTAFPVYERKPVEQADALAEWLQAGAVNVIMASSVAVVKAMSRLPGIDVRSVDWIVSSARTAEAVHSMGGRVAVQSQSAEAEAMTAAACRWWSSDEGDRM
ncbi:MAG: uroporphyrinogen-III synthase [Gammaproteobacteria bacterium]|nr:uroporphyrinogen-III synthase [Gammaproteobacteria bacterium]